MTCLRRLWREGARRGVESEPCGLCAVCVANGLRPAATQEAAEPPPEPPTAEPEPAAAGTEPAESAGLQRPSVRAPKADWVAYATAHGMDADEADALSKRDLIDHLTGEDTPS